MEEVMIEYKVKINKKKTEVMKYVKTSYRRMNIRLQICVNWHCKERGQSEQMQLKSRVAEAKKALAKKRVV